MKLAADKPRVIGQFDHFDQFVVHRQPGNHQAGVLQAFQVIVVEFVTVAVAFVDFLGAVGAPGARARAPACRFARRGAWCRRDPRFRHRVSMANRRDRSTR